MSSAPNPFFNTRVSTNPNNPIHRAARRGPNGTEAPPCNLFGVPRGEIEEKRGGTEAPPFNLGVPQIMTHAFGIPKSRDVALVLKKHPQVHFHVSKAVLGAFSEVFGSMFSGGFAEQKEDLVQLNLECVSTDDFKFFLEWLYSMRDLATLREETTEHRFMALIDIANMFDVELLKGKLTDRTVLPTVKWLHRIDKELFQVAVGLSREFGQKVYDFLFDFHLRSQQLRCYKQTITWNVKGVRNKAIQGATLPGNNPITLALTPNNPSIAGQTAQLPYKVIFGHNGKKNNVGVLLYFDQYQHGSKIQSIIYIGGTTFELERAGRDSRLTLESGMTLSSLDQEGCYLELAADIFTGDIIQNDTISFTCELVINRQAEEKEAGAGEVIIIA